MREVFTAARKGRLNDLSARMFEPAAIAGKGELAPMVSIALKRPHWAPPFRTISRRLFAVAP